MSWKTLTKGLVLCFLLNFPSDLYAATCSDVFKGAIGSNYNQGELTMYSNSQIINDPDNQNLPFKKIKDQIANNTCGSGVTCGISGSASDSLTMPSYLASSNTSWYDYNNDSTISSEHNGNVSVNSGVTLGFAAANSVYRFTSLTINTAEAMLFPPGDYYFGSLTLNSNASIVFDSSRGTGGVRFHILGQLTLNNDGINKNGDPNDFAIFIHSQNQTNGLVLNSNSGVTGFVYVEHSKQGNNIYGKAVINSNAYVKGRLSVSSLTMNSSASVEYAGDANQVDIGSACEQTNVSSCPVASSQLSDVIINEIHIENKNNWIELYVKSANSVDLNGWKIKANGTSTGSQFEATLFNSSTSFNSGSYIVFEDTQSPHLSGIANKYQNSDIEWHNNFQEILLVDSSDNLVHYLHYANNNNNADLWSDCLTDYPNATTDIDPPGNNGTACAITDGETDTNDWDSNCDQSTPGSSNAEATSLLLHYPFDSGSGQTASDSSGNNYDATFGSSNSSDNQDPTWQCADNGYSINLDSSSNQRLIAPSFAPPANGTVAFWFKIDSFPTSRQRIFGFGDGYEARWESGNTVYWDINKTGSNSSISTTFSNSDLGEWVHIAILSNANDNTWSVYKDGELDDSGTETLTAQSASVFHLGGSSWRSGSQSFHGSIDDFRIYTGALTEAEIDALVTLEPVDCAATVDHYEITHDTSALTCTSADITVKACADANCTLYDQVTNASLTKTISGTTTTVDSAAFTGSKSISLQQTSAATVTLGLTNLSPSAPVTCNTNGNCEVVFSNSGFVLSSVTNGTSCQGSSVTIQALKDDGGATCAPAWVGDRDLNISFSYHTPNSNAWATQLNVTDKNTTHGINANTNQTIELSFNNSAEATANFTYNDAGQLTITASDPDAVLQSSSSTILFAPSQFVLSSSKDGITFDNDTSNTIAADDFSLKVEAQCSNGTNTANYQPGDLEAQLTRTIPSVNGIDGTLTYANSQSTTSDLSASFVNLASLSFSQGVYLYNSAQYSEVGSIQLSLRDNNYQGLSFSSNTLTLGGFIPAKLEIYTNGDTLPSGDSFTYADETILGSLDNLINNTFTYLGQSFGYITNDAPRVMIIALNADNQPTFNYSSVHSTANINADTSNITASATDNGINLTSSLANGSLTDNGDGSFSYQFSSADNFIHTRGVSELSQTPFVTNIALSFATNTFYDASINSIQNTSTASFSPAQANIRLGRLKIGFNYGPETDNLSLPLEVQYLDATSTWVTNSTDSQTSLASSLFTIGGTSHNSGENWETSYNLTPTNPSLLLSPSSATNTATPSIGLYDFEFQAPGSGKQGKLPISIDLSSLPYFRYDWDSNSALDDSISSSLIWGVYRGSDKVIFWREN